MCIYNRHTHIKIQQNHAHTNTINTDILILQQPYAYIMKTRIYKYNEDTHTKIQQNHSHTNTMTIFIFKYLALNPCADAIKGVK